MVPDQQDSEEKAQADRVIFATKLWFILMVYKHFIFYLKMNFWHFWRQCRNVFWRLRWRKEAVFKVNFCLMIHYCIYSASLKAAASSLLRFAASLESNNSTLTWWGTGKLLERRDTGNHLVIFGSALFCAGSRPGSWAALIFIWPFPYLENTCPGLSCMQSVLAQNAWAVLDRPAYHNLS